MHMWWSWVVVVGTLVGCGCVNMSTRTVPPFAVLEIQSTLCFNHSKEQLIKSGGGLRRQDVEKSLKAIMESKNRSPTSFSPL